MSRAVASAWPGRAGSDRFALRHALDCRIRLLIAAARTHSHCRTHPHHAHARTRTQHVAGPGPGGPAAQFGRPQYKNVPRYRQWPGLWMCASLDHRAARMFSGKPDISRRGRAARPAPIRRVSAPAAVLGGPRPARPAPVVGGILTVTSSYPEHHLSRAFQNRTRDADGAPRPLGFTAVSPSE